MPPGALPLPQLILLDIVAPPIMAALWWLKARGMAGAIQGGTVSKETRRRQKQECLAILCLCYLLAFGFTLYAWLT